MKLFKDRVLIKVDPDETETRSGIKIARSWVEKAQTGTVVSVGSEVAEVEEGDHVLFARVASMPAVDPDEVICLEEHVFARL